MSAWAAECVGIESNGLASTLHHFKCDIDIYSLKLHRNMEDSLGEFGTSGWNSHVRVRHKKCLKSSRFLLTSLLFSFCFMELPCTIFSVLLAKPTPFRFRHCWFTPGSKCVGICYLNIFYMGLTAFSMYSFEAKVCSCCGDHASLWNCSEKCYSGGFFRPKTFCGSFRVLARFGFSVRIKVLCSLQAWLTHMDSFGPWPLIIALALAL